ncbi:MAG: efflux RND transporter periplasmic adaptor subunit [Acidobacteriales bacterium]|nr:efflux RND transporter periplasmic adaptor subunit [Terriglobales bacterium]
MNRRLWLIVGAVVLAVILLGAYAALSGEAIPVRAEQARRETIVNTISTNGKVEPVENFEAHAPIATTVRQLLVREGDTVKKGQLLLRLDDAEARAQAARALSQLRAAEANLHAVQVGGTQEEMLNTEAELVKARGELDAAQRNLESMRRLQQRGAASPAEVQAAEERLKAAQAEANVLEQKVKGGRFSRPEVARAQAQVAEARAAYAAARELVGNSNVVSPRPGIVYFLPAREGAYVNPGDLLVQVADLKRLQIRGYVDEPDIGRLGVDQKVNITWDAIPGRTWEGQLTRVPTTVTQRGTRNVGEITVEVSNPDMKLLPNTNVNVSVMTAMQDNALTVSREAIRQEGGHRFVYQIRDGELHPKEVETGISNLTRVEIKNGLKEGELVALGSTNPLLPLKSGEAVRIVAR